MKRGRATAILPEGRRMEVAYELRGRNPKTQRIVFWPYWAEAMPEDRPSRVAMWQACVDDIDSNGITPREPPPRPS